MANIAYRHAVPLRNRICPVCPLERYLLLSPRHPWIERRVFADGLECWSYHLLSSGIAHGDDDSGRMQGTKGAGGGPCQRRKAIRLSTRTPTDVIASQTPFARESRRGERNDHGHLGIVLSIPERASAPQRIGNLHPRIANLQVGIACGYIQLMCGHVGRMSRQSF